MFPVLLHYPELSSTRRAQYETAVKNGNATSYLYDFYRMWRRGLAQAPIEREAVLAGSRNRGKVVLSGSTRFFWRRWAAIEVLEAWEVRELCRRTQLYCRSVLFAQ